jgi:hypothetical protein
MKELIYRNEAFEAETRAGMQVTLTLYNELLSCWNGLDVGECQDIFRLATNASQIYKDHFETSLEVPLQVGRLMVNKQAYINLVEMPVPNSLYISAKKVTKSPGFGYVDCFVLQDNRVVLDEERAEAVILSQNVYAESEAALIMGLAVPLYVKLSCFLNSYFKVIEWRMLPALPFTLTGRSYPNIADLTLEVEQMRLIMSNLQGDVPEKIRQFLPADFDLEQFKAILKKL